MYSDSVSQVGTVPLCVLSALSLCKLQSVVVCCHVIFLHASLRFRSCLFQYIIGYKDRRANGMA